MERKVSSMPFPVQQGWIVVNTTIVNAFLFITILLLEFDSNGNGSGFPLYLIIAVGATLLLFLEVKYFFYLFEDKYMSVKQGIISRKESFLPYATIQNIYVEQGLIDRLCGFFTVVIENAAEAGGYKSHKEAKKKRSKWHFLGFSGNKLIVPGLSHDHAEALKKMVLDKIRENPADDKKLGL